MKTILKKMIRKVAPFAFLAPEGDRGIEKRGHRGYIGGLWDEIGQLQFNFLLNKGLKPDSFLLDIACGSLRLGVKAIPYLRPSHYLGIEKESGLVKAGLEKELDPKIREEKQPNIIISDSFEFEKLGQKANFAIAQSLFTHLPPNLINLCFKRLYPYLENDGVFYATFFKTDRKIRNPKKPHDHGFFAYTKEEMIGFGETNGFVANYIGDWNHPRHQVIVEYRKS
ncbi:MAG: hypothetical protein ACKPBV_00785 [Sphaerospermopsis kisseleviana]